MTTIIVTNEDNETDEFAFDANDRVISIGRRSTNDVCIPNLSVSGMHARLTIDGDSALIEDNSSTNGTYVNGRLISRQLLNDNDEIVIGKTRVTVQLSQIDYAAELAQAHAPAELQQVELQQADALQIKQAEPPVLKTVSDYRDELDDDDSFLDESTHAPHVDHDDERPMSLSEKAKLALGRQNDRADVPPSSVSNVAAVASGVVAGSASAAASRAFAHDSDIAVAESPAVRSTVQENIDAHPLDGLDGKLADDSLAQNLRAETETDTRDKSTDNASDSDASVKSAGAVIEIQNGAKSGQVLPIDKPVTTLGRPGIQIAAIMRKPDGYFLMHIESDDSVDMPTLNRDTIGDDPVMLHSGDRLNVAGIDVEFMLA